MAKRFGINGLFSKKNETEFQSSLDESEIPEIYESDENSISALLSAAEEDTAVEADTITFDGISDQKVLEAERIAKKVSALSNSIEQVTKFSQESNANIASIVKFMEMTKADIKQRSKMMAENAEMRADMLTLTSERRRLQQDLETARSEINTLRKNGAEVQHTLKETRESINNMRHSNKKMSDEFRVVMAENTELKEKLVDAAETYEDLSKKYETSESQRQGYKFELDGANKHIAEFESLVMQKDEAIATQSETNRTLTSDLGVLNRQFNELQDEKIALESQLSLEQENLDHIKRISEQDQRKHDNEIYALRSEIENIASQWRHSKAAAKEISAEVRALRERARGSKTRIQELEQELEAAQDLRERQQDDLLDQGSKFRELNLQYESALIELKQEQLQTAQLTKTVKQLSDETKKTQGLRIRYESALDQIKELKALIQDYQLIKQQNITGEVYREVENYDDDDIENVIPLVAEGEK